jgi:LysM repeat protein
VKIKAIHTVGPGDVLRVVAEKYKVSKKSIMDANHKSEDVTLRGEQLVIPVK